MESEKTYSILVVDDDAGISAFMQRRLQQVGYQVRLKFTGREATDWLKANRADLMLLDMELPDMKGYEVVEELERECRSIPFVVITGHGDEQLAVDMMKAGAVDYVIKDPSLPELLNSVVERAFRQIEQEQQLHEAEEALRRAYDELEVRVQQRTAELAESEVKYRTLVENLPQNIFFKNADSRYVSCNHNFARYLGTSPARIVGKTDYDFCPPDEAEKYRQEDIRILQDGRTEEIEERLFRDGQERIELKIKTPVKDEEGKVVGILGIFWDITERKKSEDALRLSHHILEIVVRQRDPKELLNEVIAEVRDFTGCEAIAIRILDENDNIPYQALIGFSKRFYDLESPLSIKKDRCMCINVICGRTLPKASFYTDGGSFYMNGTTRFLSTVSEKQKGQTRNVCNEFGYESVALIPIRIGDTILGLIHIADRKENRVPLEKVETLEKIAMELAAAILRSRAEEALRISEARLRQVMESMPVMMEAFDQKGNIIFWSKECERVTGYTAAEIEGNPRAMEMLYPDLEYRRRIMEEWRRRGNNYRNWERTLTCKDGNKQIISWSNISDRAPIPGWASWGIGLDVTENKRAEDERLNRFRRLRRQQTAIVRMAVDKSVAAGHLKDAFRLITQNAAHALNVARAGIWLLSKDSRQMKCVDLYQSATERHSEGD
ncbi:MAG: PAS domain S-box protein, partial [Sedimentisphaerales bacterium]|nr:PAS domain S-box protein [Sedimentisphaerales bacterium]